MLLKTTVPCDHAPVSAVSETELAGLMGAVKVSTMEVDPWGRVELGSHAEGEIRGLVSELNREENMLIGGSESAQVASQVGRRKDRTERALGVLGDVGFGSEFRAGRPADVSRPARAYPAFSGGGGGTCRVTPAVQVTECRSR